MMIDDYRPRAQVEAERFRRDHALSRARKKPTITHRYPPKYVLQWALLVIGTLLLLWAVFSTASAQAPSEHKSDGECTGLETAGRCTDKCPEGSYNIGLEKNGAAVCKLNPTGCPYGDSIPIDSPKCAPSTADVPQSQETSMSQNIETGENPVETVGK